MVKLIFSILDYSYEKIYFKIIYFSKSNMLRRRGLVGKTVALAAEGETVSL